MRLILSIALNYSKLSRACLDRLSKDACRLICVLLANTSLQVVFNGITTEPFASNIGSTQGDALSPLLFAIYLEAAMRELSARGPQRPVHEVSAGLPSTAVYADDTDFISLSATYLDEILRVVGPIFGEFDLLVNVEKTDRTIIGHADLLGLSHGEDADLSAWRKTRKLGSLLGVEEDVNNRIKLANLSFKSLQALWKRPDLVSECNRLRSYRVIVESVLLYNCGTWALTQTLADKLDRCQRSMLRRVVGLSWYDKVSNDALYKRCGITPASIQVLNARWRLFGHTLRMNDQTPAKMAMAYYFVNDQAGRKGNRVTIATLLSNEYQSMFGMSIRSTHDYLTVAQIAQNRVEWREVVQAVTSKQIEIRDAKIQQQNRNRRKRMQQSARL